LKKSKKNNTNVGTKADVESAHHEYAFDNPYFKEDDAIDGHKKDNNQTQKETIILLEGKPLSYLVDQLMLRLRHIIRRMQSLFEKKFTIIIMQCINSNEWKRVSKQFLQYMY